MYLFIYDIIFICLLGDRHLRAFQGWASAPLRGQGAPARLALPFAEKFERPTKCPKHCKHLLKTD